VKNLFRRPLVALAAVALTVGAAVAQQTPPQPMPKPVPVPHPAVPQMPVPPPPDVDGQSWVLMDYTTGQIIASKNPDEHRAPASLTKVMTDYVVSSEIAAGYIHLTDMVTISKQAWEQGGAATDGSTSFLKEGSQVSVEDLLKGMIVQSGNDAAIALAQHTAGSQQAFVGLMNTYAQQLGMTDTHYSDVNGYPIADHYSSARDIAILTLALIHNYPADYAISKIKQVTLNGITQPNRNVLLWRDPSVDGVKTGYTAAAGYCMDASAKRGDERMIAVVMGASSEHARADSAMALLNYGFRYYKTIKLYAAGKPLASPRLWKGAADHLPIGVTQDVLVTVKTGDYDKLKADMDIPAILIAPFKKGQKVGTLDITMDGKPLENVPLVALDDAPQGGFFKRLWDAILLWFHHDSGKAGAKPAGAK